MWGRAESRKLLPADTDQAAIRLVDTRNDLAQRRLAAAVRAQQGVRLPRQERNAHVVKRLEPGESLGNARN